jgi:lamin B
MSTCSSQDSDSVSSFEQQPSCGSDNFKNGPNNGQISSISPTRLQEIEEMQSLNDRLINYIEIVRILQSENHRLKTEISSRQVSEIKVMYEQELEDSRHLIDQLAKEKARSEINVDKFKANAIEAQEKAIRFEKEATVSSH